MALHWLKSFRFLESGDAFESIVREIESDRASFRFWKFMVARNTAIFPGGGVVHYRALITKLPLKNRLLIVDFCFRTVAIIRRDARLTQHEFVSLHSSRGRVCRECSSSLSLLAAIQTHFTVRDRVQF